LKKILLVDDEKLIIELAAEALADEGFEILEAYDGQMALEILRSGAHADFVFADIQMPKMDGLDLLKCIKKEFPHIAVCMVSGYSQIKEEELLALGAIGYISKPYSADFLCQVARDYLLKTNPPSRLLSEKYKPGVIYVVEDDIIDQDFLKTALLKELSGGPEVELKFFNTGECLIAAMKNGAKLPNLLIFDINLPGISGFEAIERLNKEKAIPFHTNVVVLSGSDAKSDIANGRSLNIDCFYKKPTHIVSWDHVARAICQSWLN